jgi:hypothetical protein
VRERARTDRKRPEDAMGTRTTRRDLERKLTEFEQRMGVTPGTYEIDSYRPGSIRLYSISCRGRRLFFLGSEPIAKVDAALGGALQALDERDRQIGARIV